MKACKLERQDTTIFCRLSLSSRQNAGLCPISLADAADSTAQVQNSAVEQDVTLLLRTNKPSPLEQNLHVSCAAGWAAGKQEAAMTTAANDDD